MALISPLDKVVSKRELIIPGISSDSSLNFPDPPMLLFNFGNGLALCYVFNIKFIKLADVVNSFGFSLVEPFLGWYFLVTRNFGELVFITHPTNCPAYW